MGFHVLIMDLLLDHDAIFPLVQVLFILGQSAPWGYCNPRAHPYPTLGVVLGVTISSPSFCKTWCFTVIMFWLQTAEERNDYRVYCLLEFSTRAMEQLWLKWRSIYIAVFLPQVFPSTKKKIFAHITLICKSTLIKSTGTWSHSQKEKQLADHSLFVYL